MSAEPQSQHWVAPWCEEDDIPGGRRVGVEDVTLAFAIGVATDLLYVLSGRQFRTGRSLIRPTPIDSAYGNQSYLYPYSSMSGYGAAWGFAAGWAWTAMGMGWWQGGQDLSEVVLQGPVLQINEVIVDGASLDPSNYTLYDRRRLVRNVDTTGRDHRRMAVEPATATATHRAGHVGYRLQLGQEPTGLGQSRVHRTGGGGGPDRCPAPTTPGSRPASCPSPPRASTRRWATPSSTSGNRSPASPSWTCS